MGAAEFAETDLLGGIELDAAESRLVGAQRRSGAPSIAIVVLGAGGGIPIAEALQLFGVDGKHGIAAFDQGFHHGAAGRLDSHGGVGGHNAVVSEPILQFRKAFAAVRDAGFATGLAIVVE